MKADSDADALKRDRSQMIELLYNSYYDALRIYAMKYVNSMADADDVVQEVFLSMSKKDWTEFHGNVRSYLFGAVTKSALKFLRESSKCRFCDIEEEFALFEGEESFYELYESGSLAGKLMSEIDNLPPRSKEVFIEIAINRKEYKQVARLLGVSVNTVKTHYGNALSRMRKISKTIKILFFF